MYQDIYVLKIKELNKKADLRKSAITQDVYIQLISDFSGDRLPFAHHVFNVTRAFQH